LSNLPIGWIELGFGDRSHRTLGQERALLFDCLYLLVTIENITLQLHIAKL